VVIPQNTNPIPTAITSPMSGNMMSPGGTGGYVRRAAPEPNKRALYVGGLDPRVTEDILRQIFETTGHVQSVKIIPDKNVSSFRALSLVLHFLCHSLDLLTSSGFVELSLSAFFLFSLFLLPPLPICDLTFLASYHQRIIKLNYYRRQTHLAQT
jgi:hypothetical protein